MSNLEIAEITGLDHARVMSGILRAMAALGIDHVPFLCVDSAAKGGAIAIFRLPRKVCERVVGLGDVFTETQYNDIVRRWDAI